MDKIYFIDFENVSDAGLDGYFDLDSEDCVTVFYTEKAGKMSIDFVNLLNRCDEGAKLIFIKVQAGKQALDLQLATYLGAVISKYGEGKEYIIVSKDKGYGNVISFWTTFYTNLIISQQARISVNNAELLNNADNKQALKKKRTAPLKASEAKAIGSDRLAYNNLIHKTLSKAGKYEAAEIGGASSIATKAMGSQYVKRDVYQALIKQFGRKKGTAIYNVLKPILK